VYNKDDFSKKNEDTQAKISSIMRNLTLVLVLALVSFLGFQSNAAVAINTVANTEFVTVPRNVVDVIVHGRTMEINSNEIENVQVTIIKTSNSEVIFQDILTSGDVRTLNNLAVGEYIVIAHYESNTQTQTVIIE
jgi:hypothetical protein